MDASAWSNLAEVPRESVQPREPLWPRAAGLYKGKAGGL